MGQTRLLARTFFGRLFESDLMPQGLPQIQLLVWGLVFAAGPTMGLPMLLTKKYTAVFNANPAALPLTIATDRAVLFTLSMLSIGFVGLLIWDGIFPDRRDVRILGPLPVRQRTFVAARLLALGRVFLLFAAAVCVPQTLFFGLLAWSYGDPAGLIRGVGAHLAAAAAACTLVFGTLVALQCLLLAVLGRRAAQAASVVLQVVCAIVLVHLFFFLPHIEPLLRTREETSGFGGEATALLPGMWFLGLYELLGGFATPGATTWGGLAVASTAGALLMSVVLYGVSYGRISRLALEGVPPRPRSRGARARPGRRQGEGDAIRAAIREFVLRTLVRTRQHRMILALYAGIALALALSSVLAVALRHTGPPLSTPNVSLLSIPLLLQFFPLLGIRMIAAVPVEPRASWVFRAAEPAGRAPAIDGVREAMVRAVLVPTTALALVMGWALWGAVAGALHGLFCWAVGSLLIELLIARLVKIPFTCTYLPGRARLRTMWPFYLMAFTTYCYTLAGVELLLLRTPRRMAVVCAVVLLAAWIAMFVRRRALTAAPGLRFAEEDPDAMFEGFRLSEGLAASAPARAKIEI